MTTKIYTDTSPCADIAKHFAVSQSYVDHAMEWELYEAGIRKKSPDLAHATKLQQLANEISLERRIQIGLVLDDVIRDIKADAAKRREAEAAQAALLQ